MGRWFTPSDSDGSGMVAPQQPGKVATPATAEKKKLKKRTETRYGGSTASLLAEEAEIAKKSLLGQ